MNKIPFNIIWILNVVDVKKEKCLQQEEQGLNKERRKSRENTFVKEGQEKQTAKKSFIPGL